MDAVLFVIISLVFIWIIGVTIAWLINRKELKEFYGSAPFNWRIYGWIYTYPPYLIRLQKQSEDNNSKEN